MLRVLAESVIIPKCCIGHFSSFLRALLLGRKAPYPHVVGVRKFAKLVWSAFDFGALPGGLAGMRVVA